MANSIELAKKYLPLLDEVYQASSLTSVLDVNPDAVQYAGANAVKIFKTTVQGLGNYSRSDGFVDGDATGAWETLELTKDRGRSFSIDRMDNDETLDMAFGALSGEFIRTKVTPEIDAYRFAKYASAAGIGSAEGTLSEANDTVKAIDAAGAAMDENEIPADDRFLFITPTHYTSVKQSDYVKRFATMTDTVLNRNFEVFDNMRVIKVPQTRFYSAVTLYDGKTSGQTAGGFVKAANAVDLNFMIVHRSAVLQIVKHTLPRIFDPDTNQQKDAWKFDYRIYHDAFTYENKTKGIYVHKKGA